jgi:hypothetical protein
MKKNTKNISRRSFVGTSGAVAAGLTVLPGSFLIAPGIVASGDNLENSEAWWEKEPLRIVELEEGYEFEEKFEILKDLGANTEHVTRFTDTSPGTSFLDAHNLFGGKKVNFGSLKDYLSVAHKNNIKVIIYYNVHAIEISYARQHRDWQ